MSIGKNKVGFTLIELIFVTLLILILIGLSTPLFRNTISNLILKDSTFRVSKLINYSQEMAIIKRKNFKMNFEFREKRYWLSEMDSSTNPPVYKRLAGRFGKNFTLPQGVSLEGLKNEVVFYPDGHCDEGSIDILNKEGTGYKILINGFGGRTDIKEIIKDEG